MEQEESRNMKRKRWDKKEDDIIKEMYPKIGLKVADLLPGRTYDSVRERVCKLGLSGRKKDWTEEEITLLKKWYPVSIKEAEEHIPAHSKNSICVKASQLGIASSKKRKTKTENLWTKEEDSILIEYYPAEGKAVAERFPGRSAAACAIRASVLNVPFNANSDRLWTEEEVSILKQYFPSEGRKVASRLHGRSETACTMKAQKMQLKKIKEA